MHSLFIVPAEHKGPFDEFANSLGNGGPALVLALSSTGQEPATHGWCGVSLSAEKEAEVQALIDAYPEMQVDWTRYDLSTNSNHPHTQLTARGLKLIQRNIF